MKDPELYLSRLFVSTALRSAALLATNIVFIAEFNFNISNPVHLTALSLFALSTPLLTIVALAANLWKAGDRFDKASKDYHFGPATNFASLLTIVAIGLCLWSYSWIPGTIYFVGCLYAVGVFATIMSADRKRSF